MLPDVLEVLHLRDDTAAVYEKPFVLRLPVRPVSGIWLAHHRYAPLEAIGLLARFASDGETRDRL